jgi:glycosyltransferase involved in cell wall biosynthesis
MTNLLLLGCCPLPFESGQAATGPGIRTWQFMKPLLDAGHRITALCLRTQGTYSGLQTPIVRSEPLPGLVLNNMAVEQFGNMRTLRQLARDANPHAILGVASILPNAMAAELSDIAPLWADVFGDAISEIQIKAPYYPEQKSAEELFHIWKLLNQVLKIADKFSTLSNPQRHALLGQLALMGRLNRHTADYELVHTIPCGVEVDGEIAESAATSTASSASEPVTRIRGNEVAESDFVLCWSGSYNTWMDPDTLFSGLAQAMQRDPRIKFLSLGGGTKGYDECIYDRFVKKAAKSPFKDRFIFKGWVPFSDVPANYRDCDLGINIDCFSYEAVLGSRNRVLQFLKYGVPVLTTTLSEITDLLWREGCVLSFEVGNPQSFAQELLSALKNPDMLKQIARKGRAFVVREFEFTKTLKPCLEWIEHPARSPDIVALQKLRSEKHDPYVYLNDPQRLSDFTHVQQLLTDHSALQRLRSHPFYRLARKLKRPFS